MTQHRIADFEMDTAKERASILRPMQDESDWGIADKVGVLNGKQAESVRDKFDRFVAVYVSSDPGSEEGYLQLTSSLADLLIENGFGLLTPMDNTRFEAISAGLTRIAEYGDIETVSVFIDEIIRRSDIARYLRSYDPYGGSSEGVGGLSVIETNLLLAIWRGASDNSRNYPNLWEMVGNVLAERQSEQPEVSRKNLPQLRMDLTELVTIPYMLERLLPYTANGLIEEISINTPHHRLSTQIRNLSIALDRERVDLSEIERWMLGIMNSTVLMMDGSMDATQVRTIYDGLRHIGNYGTKEQVEWWLEMISRGGRVYDECLREYIPEYHTSFMNVLRIGKVRKLTTEAITKNGFDPDSTRIRVLLEQLLSGAGHNWALTDQDRKRLGQRYLGSPMLRVPDILGMD